MMKRIHIGAFLVSFFLLLLLFSGISMIALPRAFRYTWVAMNPWNGVEGVVLTVERFLHTGAVLTRVVAFVLVTLVWWRLYAVVLRYMPRKEPAEPEAE